MFAAGMMMKMKTVTVVSAVLTATSCASVYAESAYSFRQRMERVHEPNRRDVTVVCASDDFVFRDGMTLVLPPDASDFLRRVALDFVDYLDVSMDVSVRRGKASEGCGLRAALDAELPARQYCLDVTAQGVELVGADERALAQGFYHLEDLMNLRRAPFLKCGRSVRTMRFSDRLVHSGYGHTMYPEPLLNAMAHAGMTAIILYVSAVDVTEGGRTCDHRAIIRRAAKYGLDTYLYSELPAFFHPDDGDEPFDRVFGPIAAAYPEAKGVIFVGESCQFPSKDPRVQPRTWKQRPLPGDTRPLAGWFPCKDYPDWLRAVKRAISKKSPNMKTVFWTYNWGWVDASDRLALVEALPQDTVLQATFEMFERRTLPNGIDSPTADYTLSVIGPGRYFTSEAAAAKRRGLTLFTQANAGGRTWDFGTAPYEPFPFLWNKRWQALVRAHEEWGLTGIMECHHYGWTPTFVAELEKEAFTDGGLPFEEHLRLIAARDFGRTNVPKALAAWGLWSEAMNNYVPTDLNQYGPFRCGPAYPFSAGKGKVDPTDFPVGAQSLVGHRYIRLDYLSEGFVPCNAKEDAGVPYMEKEVDLLREMSEKLDLGASSFAAMPGEPAERMARLGRYLACVCRTAENVKRGWIAASRNDECALLSAARDEYANAKSALALVEADSHLGFEPDMDYVGGPRQIRWKLNQMERQYGRERLVER